MEMITVHTEVFAPMRTVWACWTEPERITKWAYASEDWHAPSALNDLREGGTFTTVMAAKDGSNSFDLSGTYTEVRPYSLIAYTMSDGRKVEINFEEEDDKVKVTESFDPETLNSLEMQRTGWQAMLNNFKTYTESLVQ